MQSIPDNTIFESNLPELSLVSRGKVRDIYAINDDYLLIIATDRLSAYDVVLPDAIPGKGAILTAISNFWFEFSADIIDNHLTGRSITEFIHDPGCRSLLRERATVVRRLAPLPIEAIVRGYLIGSGWKDYQATGSISGIELPAGMQQAQQLLRPLFTPATKAAAGEHDENIDFATTCELVGEEVADTIRRISLAVYKQAADHARCHDIIIADTKFEFGQDDSGRLYLIDELLTPDSSRFWPVAGYRPGISPPSFDKQFVRDYLETLDWDKTAPGPRLPEVIIERTREKYLTALRLLTEQY